LLLVRLFHQVTNHALYGYPRERLATYQNTDLSGIPVADRSVIDRHERPQSGLDTRVTEVQEIQRP
jgi:hypothetical protein